MKIALLTIWHEKNYGAELQAYATVRVLQKMGHEVEMIDIRLSDGGHPNLKGYIGKAINMLSPSHREFENFWRKYIPTGKRYKSMEQLHANPPQADVYMVGSDQVWNPELTQEFAELYFLNFGSESQRRISYASSFGRGSWQYPKLTDSIRTLLGRFSYVSCREQEGVDILQKDFDISADLSVDPTMLLGVFGELTGPLCQRDTLVYYPLTTDPELDACATEAAARMGLTPINNKQCSYILPKVEWNRVSLESWVRNIAEARFVVTRSFHGLVFALLYEKQFAILAGKNGRNSRVTSLLTALGLSDRCYSSPDELLNAAPWTQPIDYARVSPIICELRKNSYNKLSEAIGK